MQEVGKVVRRERKRQKLSIGALAERAHVSPNTVGDCERGTRVPTDANLAAIAGALGLPLSAVGLKGDAPLYVFPPDPTALIVAAFRNFLRADEETQDRIVTWWLSRDEMKTISDAMRRGIDGLSPPENRASVLLGGKRDQAGGTKK